MYNICNEAPDERHLALIYPGKFDRAQTKRLEDDPIFADLKNLKPVNVADFALEPLTDAKTAFAERERKTLEFYDELDRLGVTEFWNMTPFIGEAFSQFHTISSIGILYDVIPYIYQAKYLRDDFVRRQYEAHVLSLKKYSHLVSISDQTKRDFLALWGFDANRITTIYPNLGKLFYESGTRQLKNGAVTERVGPASPGGYALCVSSYHHSKNLASLCAAWRLAHPKLPSTFRLLIVLANHTFKEQFENDIDVPEGIKLVCDVTEEKLADLYEKACLCIQPSNYEGFGYPVVEALSVGTPVLANETPIFREVGAGHGYYTDANDPERFAADIVKIVANLQEDPSIAAKSLDGIRHAQGQRQTMNRLPDVMGGARRYFEGELKKSAYALASSYYPDKCGIVDYAHNISSDLCKNAPTFVVVRSDMAPEVSLHDDYVVCTSGALAHLDRLWPELNLYYQLGGAGWQYFMWELLEKRKGISVFHDLRMARGMLFLSNALDKRRLFNEKFLPEESPERQKKFKDAIGNSTALDRWSKALVSTLDDRLSGYILKNSKKILVHDELFKDMLLEDEDCKVEADNIVVTPLSKRDLVPKYRRLNRSAFRESLGLSDKYFVVGMFGNIVRNKLILESIKVLKGLSKTYPIKIVLVGSAVDDDYMKEITSFLEKEKMSEHVLRWGWVDDAYFDRLIYACDVVCNLRYPANVGMTGPGVQAISAGTPVIVSEEAKWSVFNDETGRVVQCSGKGFEKRLATAFREIFENRDAIRTSTYDSYKNKLGMDKLVGIYRNGI
ncbi:glycosyltransferase [Desulfosediminicola sp.]|uniref:glycosyltransferase n=1 Tax=Desulfosediminicola sp. TaxID=2886825 RepID=UPI003AF21969